MGWKLTANGSRLAPRPILQKVGVYCPVVSEIIILMQVIKVKFKCPVQHFRQIIMYFFDTVVPRVEAIVHQ